MGNAGGRRATRHTEPASGRVRPRGGRGRARRGRGGQDMRAPNTGRPAVGKAGRGYRTPDSPAPPRRFALEESPAHVKHGPDRPRGAASPAHAAYTPMMPRTPTPFAPAGAEKAHAAADGSGAYQMADRRSGKRARRVLPRARRHTCRCCRALRPPSRQRALKKHMPQPMVRAHIKSSTAAAAQSTRGASSPAHAAIHADAAAARRPPHASQPSSRSHRLAEAGCAAADCGTSITRTWYGVGVGCAAAAARCASAPVSVPESVACG